MQKVEGTKVEQNGTVCIVHTPTNFDVKQFLLLLLESNIKLNYFRDISTSTRKLFQKDF